MSVVDRPGGAAARNGGPIEVDGRTRLRITGYDRLPPFLMSVPSDTDLWMFLSSAGGLTAGRTDADGALFPYVTVDQLHDAHHHTGPVTLLRVRREGDPEATWEPFAPGAAGTPTERHLDKDPLGTPVVFEEVHRGLGLAFRYAWSACDAFGHVRTATLQNLGDTPVAVTLLDGLRNVLPSGVPLAMYQHSSALVDAYKRNEVDPRTGLGLFSLTSRISDRAEAAEELRTNVVWSCGLPEPRHALSCAAVHAFRASGARLAESRRNGGRGHYLVTSAFRLAPGGSLTWRLVADAARDQAQVVALRERLLAGGDPGAEVEAALAAAAANLRRNVASADALQVTAAATTCAHHLANVLYNNMRGGVFAKHHQVPAADFADFARTRNRAAADRHAAWLAALPAELPVTALRERAQQPGDADLERLAFEYLPLHFGRRHGDPSRPWNRFSIRVREADGSRALRYEGNWRDIFQNWEALATSFPAFLPNLVAKFVNASTVDGFNPYRLTRDGIDWELEEPGHPWSNLGYWGDHQVVYLLKLLEATRAALPGALDGMLARPVFSYAQVPYRLVAFERMLEDPRATIRFDHDLEAAIEARVRANGTDGKLVPAPDGGVLHVTLFEKLLVPVLSKLSNFVPGGGIWMNTQRPEWNDANNALVGHGVSVVTLAYLRRELAFLLELLGGRAGERVAVSREVVAWARDLAAVLAGRSPVAATGAEADRERLATMAELGGAFTRYREAVYAHGFSGLEPFAVAEAMDLLHVALAHVDESLRANRREDGLWHAYNLLAFARDRSAVRLERLPEMLEGQVAALSSGLAGPEDAVRLVDAMFASALYRADQRSFMLYPEKVLPGFLEKNRVPAARATAVPLLAALLELGEASVIVRDAAGEHRFAADLANAAALAQALDRLEGQPGWREAVQRDRQAVLDLYEEVFRHHAFTGRSGTMYAYEGIGSIYWHMVAKLLLAVQEVHRRAQHEGAPPEVLDALAERYERVRAGLGFEKSAEEYGAFPTDPYSHTPAGAGAQQPGMTGQVKEEILTRLGELGVEIEAGRVAFRPRLLRAGEFLERPATLEAYAHDGTPVTLPVPAGCLAFTLAQVPVRYERTDGSRWLRVTWANGRETRHAGEVLDAVASDALLARDGAIAWIDVGVPVRGQRAG